MVYTLETSLILLSCISLYEIVLQPCEYNFSIVSVMAIIPKIHILLIDSYRTTWKKDVIAPMKGDIEKQNNLSDADCINYTMGISIEKLTQLKN